MENSLPGIGIGKDLGRPVCTIATDGIADLGMLASQDGRREKRGIDGAGLADGQGRHWNTGGHLNHRQQRVHPLEVLGVHGHTQNRQRRLGSDDTGQVGGATGRTDKDFYPTLFGLPEVVEKSVGGPMCRKDAHIVGDLQSFQSARGVLHRFPIGARPHDHSDKRFHGTGIYHRIEPGTGR